MRPHHEEKVVRCLSCQGCVKSGEARRGNLINVSVVLTFAFALSLFLESGTRDEPVAPKAPGFRRAKAFASLFLQPRRRRRGFRVEPLDISANDHCLAVFASGRRRSPYVPSRRVFIEHQCSDRAAGDKPDRSARVNLGPLRPGSLTRFPEMSEPQDLNLSGAIPGSSGLPRAFPVQLSFRQRALWEALTNFSSRAGSRQLGPIYLGVLECFERPASPDVEAHAAHGARELMEKLSFLVLSGPDDTAGNLDDRVAEILLAQESARSSLPQDRASWADERVSSEITELLDVIDKVAAWRNRNRYEPGAAAGAMAQFCFDRLPTPSRLVKQREWRDLRNYFNSVAHHRSLEDGAATLDQVKSRFEQLEEYLNARWAPATVRDLAAIDRLLDRGSTNANR